MAALDQCIAPIAADILSIDYNFLESVPEKDLIEIGDDNTLRVYGLTTLIAEKFRGPEFDAGCSVDDTILESSAANRSLSGLQGTMLSGEGLKLRALPSR